MKFERTTPTFSIVIASWFKDGQHGKYGEDETVWFALECLNKLIKNTPRAFYELILIDNGSTLYKVLFPDFFPDGCEINWYWNQADILIRNKENLGFAPAYNQGFALARGKYVVCMNNDIIVYPGWLDALCNTFDMPLDIPVGVVMPALLKETRDAREALKIERPDLSANKNVYGPQAEFGSLWMIKRELLEQLKAKDGYYFDENFRCGFGEDRDVWKRIRREGFETYRTHNTRVFHQGNMSMSKIEDRKQYTVPNREYLRKKWNITEEV